MPRPFFPVFVLLLAAAPASAGEPGALDEVVVTASLRRQPLDEMPASISVLGAETLELAGLQHFQDVMHLVPNLNWAAGTARPRYLQLRGIGELEQYQGAPNPSVGFLIDDIDFSGIGMPATSFDVEQIEVLRGPQGSAYGANALAGLVSVRTRAPSFERELRAEASLGDYDTRSAGLALGGPLGSSQRAAWRLAAQNFRSDGFRRNVFLGRDDTNGFDETTARAKLRLLPVADLTVDLTAMYADIDDGYDAFSIDNSRITRSDHPGRDAQRSAGFAARIVWDATPGLELRSITTAADSDIVYAFDGDWGNDRDWGIFAPYDYTSQFLRERRTLSQDLRASSVPGAAFGGHADWLAGLYALRARETNDQVDRYNGEMVRALVSRYEATNLAAYGQLDLHPGPRLTLTGGLRIERRQARYADTDDSRFDPTETMSGGQLVLRWERTPDTSVYGSVSRGYKAGGFNIGPLIPVERREFGAETLLSLELGATLRRLGGRFETRSAVFFMRRTDQQVSTSFQLDAGDPLSYVFLTDNAARGENYGLESSARLALTGRLSLDASLGLLRTRYLGYHFGDRNLDGREQAHAPDYQYTLGVQYRHPRGWLARLDVHGSDGFYFDASNDERAPAFTLVNLKLGYATSRWTAYAWARNLFDANYAMRGFFFGVEPPDFPSRRYVQSGDPRQLGVTIELSFK